MLPHNIPSRETTNNVVKMKRKSLMRIVPCAILLSGNKRHKLCMALGGNEIPGASFFFSFDQKAKESTFVSVFVFVCLLFFFFFFSKSGVECLGRTSF